MHTHWVAAKIYSEFVSEQILFNIYTSSQATFTIYWMKIIINIYLYVSWIYFIWFLYDIFIITFLAIDILYLWMSGSMWMEYKNIFTITYIMSHEIILFVIIHTFNCNLIFLKYSVNFIRQFNNIFIWNIRNFLFLYLYLLYSSYKTNLYSFVIAQLIIFC